MMNSNNAPNKSLKLSLGLSLSPRAMGWLEANNIDYNANSLKTLLHNGQLKKCFNKEVRKEIQNAASILEKTELLEALYSDTSIVQTTKSRNKRVTNQDGVTIAFNLIIDEIEKRKKVLKEKGSKAFKLDDFKKVQTLGKHGDDLAIFLEKISDLQEEWNQNFEHAVICESADKSIARHESLYRKSSKTILFIEFDDGTQINNPVAAKSFVAAIEKIGIEKVESLGISGIMGIPLITMRKSTRTKQQHRLGNYYILTHSSTKGKKKLLDKIKIALNVNMEVRIVFSLENDQSVHDLQVEHNDYMNYTEPRLLENFSEDIKWAYKAIKEIVYQVNSKAEERVRKSMIGYYTNGKGLLWVAPHKNNISLFLRKGQYKNINGQLILRGWGNYPTLKILPKEIDLRFIRKLIVKADSL